MGFVSYRIAQQGNRGVATNVQTSKSSPRDFNSFVVDVRSHIRENHNVLRGVSERDKVEAVKQLISTYVTSLNPRVVEFENADGTSDIPKLLSAVIQEITDYGLLTPYLRDPDVNEININGQDIWLEKKGRRVPATDEKGNRVRFETFESQDTIFRRIMGEARITPAEPIIYATTPEGYRVQAVHASAHGSDPKKPHGSKFHSMTLRKFQENKYTIRDLVRFKTLTNNAAEFLTLITKAGFSMVVAGTTSSGKTTLLNAILRMLRGRVYVVQNPSELDLRERDEEGNVLNDVVHMEAQSIVEPNERHATLVNLILTSLRYSPDSVVIGELRSDDEFAASMVVLNTDHQMVSTTHAPNPEQTIDRVLGGYCSKTGKSKKTAMAEIVANLRFILNQGLMEDGSRKTLYISEILGVHPEDPERVLVRHIFEFIAEEPTVGDDGTVLAINGAFKQVGFISDAVVRQFKMKGIPRKDYEKYLSVPETEIITDADFSGVW